jgi:prevent-host-death family protein
MVWFSGGFAVTVPRVVTADDLRSKLGRELDLLRESEDVLFVSKRGRLAAVLIDVERYRALVERSEFLEDSLAALQARDEVDRSVPWSEVRT